MDRQIVLIGGGHSHVQFLRSWREAKIPNVKVTLVSTPPLTPYSGMLPGFLAGWYSQNQMHFNLGELCAEAEVSFVCAEVESLNSPKREIKLKGGGSLSYSAASLNIGITPSLPPGCDENPQVTAVKPISALLGKWERLMKSSAKRWLVVGGGGSGFEVAIILSLRKPEAEITLLQSADDVLPTHGRSVRAQARSFLKKARIRLVTGHGLAAVEEDWAVLESGERIQFDEMLVTTGAKAASWLKQSGLPVDKEGFVITDSNLQVKGCPGLFAAGDCAHFEDRALPKSGVYAVRQGPTLIHNIRAFIGGGPLRVYHPQKRTLALFTSGHKRALLSYGPFCWESAWLWSLKDRIDRRFMKAFGPRSSDHGPS